MNFVALEMLTGDRAKYLGLIFAIAFCTFLLENQTSIFASILKRTGSQILDVTDADVASQAKSRARRLRASSEQTIQANGSLIRWKSRSWQFTSRRTILRTSSGQTS